MAKIYLAIPYSYNPEESIKIADQVAALLMQQGHIVFSPISHSHSIVPHLPPEYNNHDFWMEQDLPFVEWADELWVIKIGEDGFDLIDQSPGVNAEMAHAKRHGKPITFHQYFHADT